MATTLIEVNGIGPATAKALAEHGIISAEDLAKAELGTIMAVPGFSEIRANKSIAAARAVVTSAPADKRKAPAAKKATSKPVAKKEPMPKKKKAEKKGKAKPAKKAEKSKKEKTVKLKQSAKKAKSTQKGKKSGKKKK